MLTNARITFIDSHKVRAGKRRDKSLGGGDKGRVVPLCLIVLLNGNWGRDLVRIDLWLGNRLNGTLVRLGSELLLLTHGLMGHGWLIHNRLLLLLVRSWWLLLVSLTGWLSKLR